MKRRHQPQRAIALVTTLLFSVILLMMVVALIKAVNMQGFTSRSYHDEVAALYVAEAGLADTMSRLEIDAEWSTGFQNEPMRERPGEYTVVFHTDETPGRIEDWHSVNNLKGTASVPGPAGRVVPKGSAVVIVVARVGPVEKQLEAVINSAGVINVEYPMMASDKIRLKGSLSITGLKSLTSYERLAAGLHSNRGNESGPAIAWDQGRSSNEALVTGKVSTVDHRSVAIDFGSDPSAYDVGAFETDSGERAFPKIGDIPFHISNQSSKPPPPIVPGGTTSLDNGSYYASGDLDVQGDLVLDGTDLFVSGNLNVNGGISGEGAVWVGGVTEFKGDSSLLTDQSAAIMSGGGVNLLGFDGNEFMEDLASRDPEVETLWDATVSTLGQIEDEITNGDPEDLVGEGGTLDVLGRSLGDHPENPDPDPSDVLVGGDYFGKLKDKLESEPSSEARDFLIDKMDDYGKFFQSTDAEDDRREGRRFGRRPWTRPGAFDAVVDADLDQYVGALMTQVTNVSYDKLGSSYFQGLIYTNGHVFASNNVTALGAVLVDGKGDTPSPNPLDPSEDFMPGELQMRNGANITFIEDFFEEGDAALKIRGPVRVRTWAAR